MTRKELRFVEILLEWCREHRRAFPWRVNSTPYRVLLAEVLLQRTPADRVAKIFPEFAERFPDPQSIVSTDLDSLQNLLQPMGLKKRSRWLRELMEKLCEKHRCRIPDKEDQLMELPGVGLYTARAVLTFGFRRDVAVVDVNVVRVLSRVFGIAGGAKRPNENNVVWVFAAKLIPGNRGPQYNEALLDHAALVCRKSPLCGKCPMTRLCDYYGELSLITPHTSSLL